MNIVALSIENDTPEQVVEVYNQKINELLNQNKITQKELTSCKIPILFKQR